MVQLDPMLIMCVKNDFVGLKKLVDEDPQLVSKKIDNGGRTLIHLAALQGNNDFVKYLLSIGSSVDCEDMFRFTPLMLVASGPHQNVAETLVRAGANVNAQSAEGKTALHYACELNYLHTCTYLVENSADINVAEFGFHRTPLHLAVSNANFEIVEFLLAQNGLNIDAPDRHDKNTALHLACKDGHEMIAKILIDHGANSKLKNAKGKTPIDLARFTLAQEKLS